ncbi:FecR family protein [Pedobacter sp. WC2423]|uniref:FecR family protein n=1 Tax=Pedobacter sp. WC2423 TaxID=3234142 RepID=UPI003467CAC6
MNSKKVKDEFLKAVKAYLDGTADEAQLLFVEEYFDLFQDSEDIFESMDSIEIQNIHDRMLWNINYEIEKKTRVSAGNMKTARSFSKYLYMAAAAAFVIPMSLYLYQRNQTKFKPVNTQQIAKITPGGNKAVLTLANGSKIFLTDLKNGEVANQSGVVITKNRDSQLVYQRAATSPSTKKITYNKIETPKGGQFQLILSDGTKVWLNAASSLRYPSAFGPGERKVELDGEAYFEVTKNVTKPFLVSSSKQVIEVLGTHFNVNAYTNEPVVSTTLLEGSIKVISPFANTYKIIRPGQQSSIYKDDEPEIKVKNVDTDEAVAWKNGYFMFEKEELGSILRKVSRWYDVEIENPRGEKLNKLLFSGTLSKYSDVSKVLRKLELTESIHFKIMGRRIIVMQ